MLSPFRVKSNGVGSQDQFIQGLGLLVHLAQSPSPPCAFSPSFRKHIFEPLMLCAAEGQGSSLFPSLLMTNSGETEALPSTLGGDACSHAAHSLLGPWKAWFFFGCEFPRDVAIFETSLWPFLFSKWRVRISRR